MTDTTSTPAKTKRAAVAEHWLIGPDNATVDSEEQATGIGYKLLALPNNPFLYQVPGGKAGDPATMLALMGAKTLATNVTSGARNSDKGEASPQEQRDAISDRFALIDGGTWIDRTREGVGVRIDLDTLAQAVVEVATAAGKTTDLATIRAKLDDKEYLGKIRGDSKYAPNAAVMAKYAELKGRPKEAVSVDDLLGL